MTLACETTGCDSETALAMTECGGIHCGSHAYAHRFCVKDRGDSGCVVVKFAETNRPLPFGLVDIDRRYR